MINKIEELLAEIEAFAPKTAADVEAFRIKILGKKGALGALMEEFKTVPNTEKDCQPQSFCYRQICLLVFLRLLF